MSKCTGPGRPVRIIEKASGRALTRSSTLRMRQDFLTIGVNIADMSLSRLTPGGTAYMVVRVDTEPSAAARREIKDNPAIKSAKFVQL